ncbi:MAG: hypothetical protein ACYTGB_20015, partial [Planctomycetota bacterium]
MDDLWFYDANAHRWICVYPGFKCDRYGKVKLNADGFESIDGQVLPIAQNVHAYSGVTYDTKRKRFVFAALGGSYYTAIKGRKEFMAANEEKLRALNAHGSPWVYDVREGRFLRFRTAAKRPGRRTG